MFAIVEACGRQYHLETGRFVDLDLQDVAEGDAFQFDQVLMIVDGEASTVGAPYVDGAKVTGKVLRHGKNKKVIVYHMKPKKGTRKKQGHRTHYTRVLIDTIELKDKVLAKSEGKPQAKQGGKEAKPEKAEKAEPKKKAEKAPAEKAANQAAPKKEEKAAAEPEKSAE